MVVKHTLTVVTSRLFLKDALSGVLWTIFFHRLIGNIKPSTREFQNVTYPVALDFPDLDEIFTQRIETILGYFNKVQMEHNKHSFETKKQFTITCTMNVNFSEIKQSARKSNWFINSLKGHQEEESVLWESWELNVACTINSTDSQNTTTSNFREVLREVVELNDKFKDHIPPITTIDASPFRFDIEVQNPLGNR
ncbi:hypothetical protein BABINDRAFT_173766 [Babjeviella inositovora NRRL Y-12698]|uniref:Autophagy-related protein 101 n=1 Tax=Babjeviella inositovora NRRL Y-12698 TaxID=984486 RepID=A0A1E3QZ49_9ASCO|nr:uncharacterized protein BABINDRAFT_173766 [Babjeviella inositovora NRRL Y-12698]ODQ82940.1 hypothetical protein BABINDRAFT_173766 [Babjeviella inositovora NRRL Y-12698]